MEHLRVGDRVRVPWGLDVLDGVVIEVQPSKSGDRAVVEVDLPGAPKTSEEEAVTVTLPIKFLEPADWWPTESDDTGGWATAAAYERHAINAIRRISARHPEIISIETNERIGDLGFDAVLSTSVGQAICEIKYFHRPRPQVGQMRNLAEHIYRTVRSYRSAQLIIVVSNIDLGVRMIDRQLQEMAQSGIPVRGITWRSKNDDPAIERVLTGWTKGNQSAKN